MKQSTRKASTNFARIEKIFHLLIKNYDRQAIIKEIQEDEPCAVATIDKAIREAKKELLRISDTNKEEALKEQLQRYESLYKEARESCKYKEAIAALQQIDKLKGLAVQRLDLTSEGKPFEVNINFINENLDTNNTNKD